MNSVNQYIPPVDETRIAGWQKYFDALLTQAYDVMMAKHQNDPLPKREPARRKKQQSTAA